MKRTMGASVTVTSWKDLASLIEHCSDGKSIFRGEASNSYALKPKAGRVGILRGAARRKPYIPAHEREALELFRKQARRHLGHTPSSEREWLAIAQHHGMSRRLEAGPSSPTRLCARRSSASSQHRN